MTIYLEREKIKFLGLVASMGKSGCVPTFMVHPSLMGMGDSFPHCCDPYLTYGPFVSRTLVVYGTMTTFGMMT